MTSRILAALAIAATALPASALLIRPDREDAEYLELATHYASSVALNAPDGEGVLIASRWVLTTARRAQALRGRKPAARIAAGGRQHGIASVYLHPAWKGAENDIALLYLRDDVRGVEPTRLYRASDEAGKGVIVVGHGGGRRRAAINTIDRLDFNTLALQVKPLADASDLQAAATPAETGAPAYIENDDGRFVAGILQAADKEWQTYARVSKYVPWIEAQMLQVAKDEAEALLGNATN